MGFVRAKRARSSVYIYSKKRSFISILLVSTLISTSLGTGVAALENPDQGVQIPALCDPALIAQPVQVSPSPTPTPTETPIENPETSPSPTPEILAPTPEPTPTPEVTPTPSPTPSPEFLSGDYVAPELPAAELSSPINKSETQTDPTIICPSPVTNVIVKPQNTQLEISWIPGVSAEPNTIENITDYYVKVLETAQVFKVSADRTSTTISGLTNGTSYSIIVYAASEYGSSVASELVTAIPLSGNEGEVAGIIVEFKPEANVEQGQLDVPGEELVSQVELTIENKITEDVHVVEFSEATTLEEAKTIANEISQDPQVVWAEPDQFVYTSSTEVINDPNYSTDQWNLWDKYGIGIGQTNKEMTTAWSLTAGQGITVAVIDTGITSHPDLDSQVIPGFDFVSDPEFLKATREENGPQVSFDGDYINSEKYGSLGWDDNPTDPGDWRGVGPVRNSTWHGTHIAGVIAAQSENQEGVAGIAPGAKIQPIRALSWRGGLLSDIATSITWASGGSVTGVADNPTPAKVINMSFSVNSVCPTSLQTAINDAFARGSVLVAAAGNNNDDVKNYAPANCENVISVGASNKDGKRASYSNYGLGIDVSAPGGDANDNGIYSTANSGLTEPASFGYASQQGTSISAAHVSAIAARIFSTDPTFNPTDVKSQITNKESVREFADTQCDINADIYCGEGIVSLFQIAAACSPTQTTTGGFTYVVFSTVTNCTWTPSSEVSRIDALLIAGGGSGGSGAWGGGGGAGEVVVYEQFSYTRGVAVNINVGSGGIPGSTGLTPPANASGNGSDTWLNTSSGIVAKGGGAGASYAYGSADVYTKGNNGGSGGGGTEHTNANNTGGLSTASTSGTRTGYGFAGGSGSSPGATQSGGGGGGAGAVGANGSNGVGGNGGAGVALSSWITPISSLMAAGWQTATTAGRIAGGGGGGTRGSATPGTGGSGGGGQGANQSQNVLQGTNNTGSGGGGATYTLYNTGGAGGTGLVVFKLTITPAPTIANASVSGTAKIGSTLTASAGSTTGTITSTTYQWQYSNDGSTSWTNIGSATSSTYTISGTTYYGKYLRARVTVTNSSGTATADSAATSIVDYPQPAISYNASDRNSYSSSSSSITDLSGNSIGATVVGNVTFDSWPTLTSWSFPGGTNAAGPYIDVADISTSQFNTSGITIDFDATFGNSKDSYERIIDFSEGGPGNDNLVIARHGTTSDLSVVVFDGSSSNYCTFTNGITENSLTRYTITLNGSTCVIAKNKATSGVNYYSVAYSARVTTGLTWTDNFIGKSNWSGDPQYQGLIRSLRIYAGSFTAAEIGEITYKTLTYNANSGSTPSPTSGTTSGKLQLPTATTRSGYTFLGWYDGANASTATRLGLASAEYSPAATATVYAGWSLNAPTIASASISGTAGVGQTLTASAGSPTGSVATLSYQWQSAATSGGTYSDISGAIANTYVLTSSEATKFIKVIVTNTNATGSASATSSATTEVLATPTIASATITGNKVVGETLTATANTVTGTSVTTTYEWQSSATSGGTYAAIPSATSSTYVLTSSEATKFIKVKITVTNAGGSANTTSTATTVIVSSCSATSTTPTINGVQMNVKQFLSTPSSCAWVAPSNVTGIEVLVVGGGGGGGSRHGGGGGAGGLVYSSSYSVTAGNTYAVVVGGGGTGSPGATITSGTNGGNSSFGDSLIAIGGGGGGNNSGSNGGSGGGSQVSVAGGLTTQTSPAGATGYGNNGGSGLAGTCSTSGSANTGWCGGGGGGAGAVGGAGYRNSSSNFGAGSGGIGRAYSITGTSTYYAGGGGGGTGDGVSVTASTGGQGGGGAGGFQANGTNGLANTGGGGGGAGHYGGGNYTAGNGGSGIVVVAYASAPTVNAISPTSGAIAGDVSVTITGTNFIAGSTVTIGGVSLSSVSVVSGTSITGTISANSLTAGVKDVVVTTTSGTSTGGTGLYEAVSKSTPSLSSISNVSKTYGDSTFSITTPTATVSGSTIAGSVSYSSSNTSVASVSGSTVTVVGVGTTTFTATFTPTNTSLYNSTTTTFTITVAAKPLTITAEAKSKSFGATTPTNSFTLSSTLVGSDAISSLTYTYSGTNSITAPTAVGSYTITPSSVVFSTGSASNYSITYSAGSYTIGLATQSTLTVSSTSGTYGSALTLTTSGGTGSGSVTYSATTGTATSCTVSGDSLTAGSAGTCFVTATKAADSQYSSISSTSTSVSFAKANQSSLSMSSASSVAFGSTLALTSTGGSGTGSTTYAVSSGTCTISVSTLTPGDAGSTCIITATKAADTNYNSVTTSTQTITITKINQSTLIMSSASSVAFGSTLALTSTGGSGTGSTTYAVSSGTCTISGSTLTPGDAGSSCVITATKAADTNYNSVTTSTQTITVNKANQSSLTISSTSGIFGTTLTLTTSGGTGTGSVTYAATTGTASSCTVSGTSLTAGSAGTCLVTATKATDTNYLSASSVQTTVTFAKANQSSLSISSTSGTFGSALTLTTSGGTTAGSVLYSVTAGTASTCTESGGSLTAGSAGTCLVTATMAGSGSYETVSSSQTTITFAQAAQSTLTVSSTSGTFGSALTLTTSGGSGTGSVTYAAATGTASSCTVSGTSLTAGSAGTCLVTATKAADTNYSSKASSQTTVTFAQATQSTLTVSSTSGTFGTALTLTTSGGTGTGSVTYAASTGTASSCTVSGTSLTAGSAGTCLVTATKAADTNYSAVSSTQTTVTFAQASQSSLTVSSTSGTFGSALTLATSGGSGTGSVTYSVTAGTASTCTESGGSLTAGSAGTCLVTATKASSTNYLSATTSQTTVTFAQASQSTLTVSSTSGTYGSALTLTTSGGSGTGSVTYAASTGTASSCTVSGTSLTAGSAGTCLVTATKAADTNYSAVSSAQTTVTFAQLAQSTLTVSSTSGTYGSALTLTTSGGSGTGSVTYTATTGTASSCTVSGTSLTAGSAGTCLVSATKATSTNYLSASSVETTVTFAKANQSSLTISTTSGSFGTPLTLSTSGGTGDGAVTYVATPGTATTCSISGSTLTAGSGGTCLVTATKASNTNYNSISSSQTTVTFGKRAIVLSSFTDISNKNYRDSTFTLAAPTVAGSVAGSFAYVSGTTSVATISGSTVTIAGAGTSTITATFTPTDTASYENQTITMLLTVNKKAITVTAVDKSKIYAASTPSNSFTNSTLVGSDAISSLTYTYSGTNSTTAPTTVGNYTITPSSASFSAGSSNNYTITYVPGAYSITKATPTFSGFNNVSKTYGNLPFTITAPTVSGSLAGSFTYSSSDTTAVTISSTTATVAGSGSSLITASFTPTDTTNYNSVTTTMTVSVAKATQNSLSITSSSSVNYGSTISLTTSGGSGTGAISYAVTSGTCSISSTTLTPGNAGSTCVIQATKALDANYNVATSSTQSITTSKLSQTVSFTSTAPSSPVSGDTYTPLATASSGAIPTISIDASSSSVCEINAGIVTFNSSGTCLIEADSASTTNYNAATTASQSITVAKIAQTITFTQPSASTFGDSSRSMSATSSSGLALTYSRGASTTNTACSVSTSGVVTILNVGDCQVTAAQSGNSQYDSAVSVSRTFAVNAIVPSAPFITSVSAGNASATVSFSAPSSNGGATLSAYELVAMPSSGSNVTKSNCSTSASPLACTITGLSNGVSYTFKVAAINSAGTGTYSTTSGSFTPATVANSVVNLVAQPGDGSLIVNWDQPTNLGGGSFTRYDIYYKSTGSYSGTANKQISSVTDTTWTFTGLANGTSYDVKVVAITSANASELSGNTAEVSQYPSTVASAPTNVSVSKLTATSARISWGLPLTDGGASLDATTPYVVTITGGPSAITCSALSGRTCDISGLNPASTYSISVKAQNRMGLGTAGTATYLVPSNDANLLSMDLKTGTTVSDVNTANYSPSFDANTTSYAISVANSQAYARITPSVNEPTATVKVNGVTVSSGSPRNLSLGIGSNVFTIELTAGDLITTKTYSLTITRPKASQTPLSITSSDSVSYGSTITLTTTGGSGNGLISFTTTGTCTTSFSSGNYILTPGDVGSSCAIVATKAADDDFFVANSASQTITINKTTPTLSGFSNIFKTFGDPTFTISEPTVSGSAPGVFTYSSSNTDVAILTGTTINVAGYGSSTITATFTPTSTTNYNSVIASLVMSVAKKILRVTPSDITKFYGASHPTITNSVTGLVGSDEISSISYTYAGTGSTSYFASTTNPSNTGTYSITPLITSLSSGSLNNYDITYDEAELTISKVNQSALNITSSTSATYGENLTLETSGGSGNGAITITKVSGDCTLNNSGSTYSITPGDAGNTCVVGATKAADTNHNAVSATDQTITIGKANQTLAFTSTSSSPRINDTYTPVVTSRHSSNGTATGITPTISVDLSSAAICSITAGVITFDAQGTCVINADAGLSDNYNAASTTSQTVTVAVVPSSSARAAAITINTSLIRSNIKNIIEKLLPEIKKPGNIINLPSLNNLNLKPLFPTRAVPILPNNLDTSLAITDNLGRLPLSQPGEKQMKVGNEFVPIVERVSPEGAMTLSMAESMNVAPIEVAIQATDIKGQNMPAPDDGILRAVKGQTITVAGDGLTPGSKYSVWLFSEPTKLGEGIVSDDSTFKQVFMVPDGLPTGSHTLQINGMNSDKKVVSLTTGVIITEVKQIQTISSSNSEIIAWAIIFIFLLLFIIGYLLKYIRRLQTRLL